MSQYDHTADAHCNHTCLHFVDHARHTCCTKCHPPTDASECPTVSHEDAHLVALVGLTAAVERLTLKLDELYGEYSDDEE